MNSAPRPKKIRPGEAAAAIGTTYKAISHWIARYGERGVQPKAEQTGTWLEFSWGDVGALAITKYLVDIGMSAFEAFDRAMATVQHYWPNLFDPEPVWVLGENRPRLVLGRDREGHWITNDPNAGLPLRILLDPELMIREAFLELSRMGHFLAVDRSRRSDNLTDRQRAILVLLRDLHQANATHAGGIDQQAYDGFIHKFETLLAEATQAAKESGSEEELHWITQHLQTAMSKEPVPEQSVPAPKPTKRPRRSASTRRKA